MPKNISGGNKAKRDRSRKKPVIIADELGDNQLFGVIRAKHGGGLFGVYCSDKILRMGRLCNELKNNRNPEARIIVGTYVVIELRECDTVKDKCNILTIGKLDKDTLSIFKNEDEIANEDFFNNTTNDDNNDAVDQNIDFDDI